MLCYASTTWEDIIFSGIVSIIHDTSIRVGSSIVSITYDDVICCKFDFLTKDDVICCIIVSLTNYDAICCLIDYLI